MILNINDLLVSISYALDFVEKDVIDNVTDHGKSVAYISARIGKAHNLTDEDLFDLISYALLHDNGMSNVLLHNETSLEDMEKKRIHCIDGERNLEMFPFINKKKNVILYHHEHYDGKGIFGISSSDIPFYSRIIALADCVALKYVGKETIPNIHHYIEDEANKRFDPDIVKTFLEIQSKAEFWCELESMYIEAAVFNIIPNVKINISYKELRDVSQIFSNLIDAKSHFTGNHSKGISERIGILCEYYGYEEEEYWKMRIAADLHDIGKLIIKRSILDKPGKLSENEFFQIKSHTFHTRKVLEKIRGFEEITEWASNHHEKLDGSGYPYGLTKENLDRNSRILACVDIYTALTEERPYREALKHDQTIKIMREMADNNFIDNSIVQDIDTVFKKNSMNQVLSKLNFHHSRKQIEIQGY
ncbi:MAG: hypothetical protein K0R15_174 [Clostridiales bacterium]|jgi:HD-GYP domain-containing protein (c-di-GMP phosphodiesterase class II)|nr:hypothetical protein [Clostridiales bacterium]